MSIKEILSQLNIFKTCKEQNLRLFQCPGFLFMIMGFVTMAVMLGTYFIMIRYTSPEVVIAVVAIVTIVFLVINHMVVDSFDRIAQASRMKTEFISIVSHQMRSPLSILRWSLELLRGKRIGKLNEKQKEYINIINESNQRMLKLVDDLLNVSRLEQKRFLMNPKPISLEEVVKEVVRELMPSAKKDKATLKLEIEENLPKAYTDPDRIGMVVQNLIDNAIRYLSPERRGMVAVNVKRENNNIKVSVEDNGIGVPLHLQKQVFEKFFRGDSAIRKKTQGAGLGLFIAKNIVELSGGKMNFKSRENVGSTFWFTLPIVKGDRSHLKS